MRRHRFPAARVGRNGNRLTRKRFTGVEAGTHRLSVPIPGHVRGGTARLTLYVTDEAGNIRVIRRALHVPRRR